MSYTSAPLPKPLRNPTILLPESRTQSQLTQSILPQKQPFKKNSQSPYKATFSSQPSFEVRSSLNDKIQKPEKQFGLQIQNQGQGQKQPPKGNILHVTNISTKLTYQQIKRGLFDNFSQYGRVYDVLIKTKESGQHFCFIDYDQIEHAQRAWAAARKDGIYLDGRRLSVNYCEDPKKNVDRKSQKCFLCHQMGHKAIKCPVKPQMIKPKPKVEFYQPKFSKFDNDDDNQTNFSQPQRIAQNQKKQEIIHYEQQRQDSQQSQPSLSPVPTKRDKDYLRFIKLKYKLLRQKQNKKVKKSKKKKN